MKNDIIKSITIFLLLITANVIGTSQSDYKLAEQDSLALVAFYWATDGPNWTSNQAGFSMSDLSTEWQDTYDGQFNNWFDGPVKDWFGVKVEKRPIVNSVDSIYRVTWLWPVIGRRTDGQNLLNGYVPTEVGLLTALEQIRLNGNDGFTDELIPDELYQPTLRYFDTESCWFAGGLSDEFRNCTDIRKINIRYNFYDFMPNLDFVGEEGARNFEGSQWFYNSRLSYFYMERIVDFFYTISPNPMEFGFEARDMFDVGDEIEIVAPVGSSVEMVCNDAGVKEEFITYQWFKDGLSKFGKKDKTYSLASVKESDYGHYTTRIENEYVKSYDGNGNYGEVFTKGIHLVAEPATPTITKSFVANNGQYIDLYFSKTMTDATGFTEMKVSAEGREIAVESGLVHGRIDRQVRLFLEEAVKEGEMVTLSYDSEVIKDKNGGVLLSIADMEIENRTRFAPSILEAETTLDGSGIRVSFDYFIDPASLGSASFNVEGNTSYSVENVSLIDGDVDKDISKTILLTLSESISDSAEVITVQYMEGGINGLYGGSLEESDLIPVDNNVTVDRTTVVISFEDGSDALENVVIKGSWKATAVQLYDDGTNGDAVAADNIWTLETGLADDDYKWDVYSREIISSFDTITSVDTLGNVTLTLIPKTSNADSLLNGNFILEFSVGDDVVTGDTVYGIYNRDVIFNVKLDAGGDDVYLMGINDDWNDGFLMEALGDNVYTYTLPKLTAGDFLNYNYRKGESWENETPDTRTYTVKNGENVINDEFGIFSNVEEDEIANLKVFPNPSLDKKFTLEGFEGFKTLKIYNGLGQSVKQISIEHKSNLNLDLSPFQSGVYYLTAENLDIEKIVTFKLILN
ncbi:T9SS type A sorting domain-containing protein [Portibacter lacus]|nr:T9SS type A sorting domain-containing protein [Portibacter lacus]